MNTWNFYARFYRNYRTFWPFNWILHKEKANLLELLKLLPSEDWIILDIGCGVGDSLNLVSNIKMLIGLDSNKKMAQSAAQKHSAIIIADAIHLPFKTHSISLFQMIGISEYLQNIHILFDECAQLGQSQLPFYILTTSSPRSLFNFIRKLTGHKIFIRKAKDIIQIAESKGLELVGYKSRFSQDAYLFKKTLKNA
jgi:ubiquinone/menaquinone biosynthesis C-methylase UbiE